MHMGILQLIHHKGIANTPQWKHLEIIFLQKHGALYSGIVQTVGVLNTTVYDICTTFRKHGTVSPPFT